MAVSPSRLSGAALITAMLVVALATAAAVALASRHQLDIRRTAQLLDAEQGYFYALGMESWGRVILERDQRDSERDHLNEDWALAVPPLDVPGGYLQGRIEDLHGRFNLNKLVVNGAPSELNQKRLRRLLRALELDEALADVLVDWQDEDIDPRFPDGAEDDVYLALEPPYRAANRALVSVSELLLLKGFNAEAMAALEPHVCVLPAGTDININTATAPVLQSLVEGLQLSEAEALQEDRGDEGYASVDEMLRHAVLAGREVETQGLSVASDDFLLHIETHVGRSRTLMYSWIRRTRGEGSVVLSRARGAR